MKKMNKDEYYMKLAFDVAQASKCKRAKYGSILVSRDGRIVSSGFNGKPRGSINDDVCYREGLPDNDRTNPQCCIHSESNCIDFCAPEEREGATIYVSGIPCKDCMLRIIQSRIARVVYYDGPSESGHKGNMDLEFIGQYLKHNYSEIYGYEYQYRFINKDKTYEIEIVPFKF